MRYAENGDMLDFIRQNGLVPERQAKIWFRQMVQGLQYLHSLNIAHRDLKCENILLSRHWNVKLADFGFARFCVDTDGNCLCFPNLLTQCCLNGEIVIFQESES